MGLPLLAIAVFGARVLLKQGPWMDRVRITFGYVMVGMAVMMLTRFLPGDATDQELLKHWSVMGPPTLILVGPDGKERRDLRVVGDVNVREFLERLNTAGTP